MATAIRVVPRSPGPDAAPLVAAPIDIDAGLMLRVRDGDVASFTLLSERHRQTVVHFLFRMVQNQAIAEELTQDVFLRVFRSRESYEASAKFTTWLFRIATNLAFNWLRDEKSAKLRDSLEDDSAAATARRLRDAKPNAETLLVQRVKRDEVREAVSKLPAKQRAAVLMHKYGEMEYSQIATVLGCSESAVKSLLFRAYENLRLRLSQYAG